MGPRSTARRRRIQLIAFLAVDFAVPRAVGAPSGDAGNPSLAADPARAHELHFAPALGMDRDPLSMAGEGRNGDAAALRAVQGIVPGLGPGIVEKAGIRFDPKPGKAAVALAALHGMPPLAHATGFGTDFLVRVEGLTRRHEANDPAAFQVHPLFDESGNPAEIGWGGRRRRRRSLRRRLLRPAGSAGEHRGNGEQSEVGHRL